VTAVGFAGRAEVVLGAADELPQPGDLLIGGHGLGLAQSSRSAADRMRSRAGNLTRNARTPIPSTKSNGPNADLASRRH
jgi:hypothetical protein